MEYPLGKAETANRVTVCAQLDGLTAAEKQSIYVRVARERMETATKVFTGNPSASNWIYVTAAMRVYQEVEKREESDFGKPLMSIGEAGLELIGR